MDDVSKHHAGMYSDKFFHKKVIEPSRAGSFTSPTQIQCDQGRYITIGDPYKDPSRRLPGRWKAKQMGTARCPENAGGGYFGLMGQPFIYVPDRYEEQMPYAKAQPLASRKLAFGTHDASKRDEFTHRMRTEQYRELLKREKRLLRPISEAELTCSRHRLARAESAAAIERSRVGLDPPAHLYDIGKARETPFDLRLKRDAFYNAIDARTREPRLGPYRTASHDIGQGAWKAPRPEHHGKSHATRTFYNHGHLDVGDI